MHAEPMEIRLSEAERIARVYYRAHDGDGWAALVHALEDALADLAEAERQSLLRGRLISHGYVRGGLTGDEAPR